MPARCWYGVADRSTPSSHNTETSQTAAGQSVANDQTYPLLTEPEMEQEEQEQQLVQILQQKRRAQQYRREKKKKSPQTAYQVVKRRPYTDPIDREETALTRRYWPTEDFLRTKRWYVKLTQDHGNTRIRIPVRKFNPIQGDILFYRWEAPSGERTCVCPPYAVTHVEEVCEVLRNHIERTVEASEQRCQLEKRNTQRDLPHRYANHNIFTGKTHMRDLVKNILELWVAVDSLRHDGAYAERYSNYPLLEGFYADAKTILAYFQYWSKGGVPFMLDWSDGTVADMSEITDEQVEYVRTLVSLVQQQGNDFLRLKESSVYKEGLYFGAQLFEKGWQPSHTL
ncbi:hypothetical protein K458DRAFT_389259 [Lentithecium fluviatile CBS 122367]|uniref:Uncharacterized protein n=1 Tax=Lentithecium fluviatile CBS 122367 TaxID=1168545 RepID=A0A6G1J1H0_9PLEO|nr:hypothetical protein K458DRAFT_389259 [Lentithecium fluviatile CBS 122367]